WGCKTSKRRSPRATLEANCHFCAEVYRLHPAELTELVTELETPSAAATNP
ncbi:MAG: hypothetical protein HC918_13220, partial [Oscillatoriales cyanobacterium SM2_1_8]|nr:hypothetical protein [Oscillatoriales cyanobacterium SM2_1_8]